MIPAPFKKMLAFGGGVGIQIVGPRGSESLRIAAARVRPGRAQLRGGFTIEDFPHQPAGQWGADYAAFLKKLGLRYVAATVILPRADVIVRPLTLPGVSDKDLDSAVRFQMDGLHPYNEDDVYSSYTRLPGTPLVLVAVARRETVERYAAPFEEAGIKIGGFTCSAAAVYSALRLFGTTPAAELLALDDSNAGSLEYYGESPARPVFSASFDSDPERAATLAAAELRIAPDTRPVALAELLGGSAAGGLRGRALFGVPASQPAAESASVGAPPDRLGAALGSLGGFRGDRAGAGRRARDVAGISRRIASCARCARRSRMCRRKPTAPGKSISRWTRCAAASSSWTTCAAIRNPTSTCWRS